jgi:hypothetical protein
LPNFAESGLFTRLAALVGACLASCLPSVVASQAGPVDQRDQFQMEELSVIQLPDTLVITQGVLSADGTALIWGPHDAWILRHGHGKPACDTPVQNVLGGVVDDSGEWTALVATPSPTLVSASADGCIYVPIRWDAGPIAAAAYLDGKWLALGPDGRITEIFASGWVGQQRVLTGLALDILQSASDTLPAWIAPKEGSFVLGMRAPPFTWVYSDGSDLKLAGNPLLFDFASGGREMISSGVVSVGEGFLQVLGDMTSSHRHLLLFNKFGEPLRASEVPIPFGVLASNNDTKSLLALRRTDRLEAVVYRYSWGQPAGSRLNNSISLQGG